MPGFKEVPERYKAPLGPYRQAPAEYGGEWWLVSPFTTPEPWLLAVRPEKEQLPDGFERIFGKRPDSRSYPSPQAYRVDLVRWNQELENFGGLGPPEGTGQKAAIAESLTSDWGLGNLIFYRNKDQVLGWRAVWLGGPLAGFDLAADLVLNLTHHAIAIYQWEMLTRGMNVEKLHPLVHPH